jgi:hypothetical protein
LTCKPDTTHSYACDCREAAIRRLVEAAEAAQVALRASGRNAVANRVQEVLAPFRRKEGR